MGEDVEGDEPTADIGFQKVSSSPSKFTPSLTIDLNSSPFKPPFMVNTVFFSK
jgi:hypothetical protein